MSGKLDQSLDEITTAQRRGAGRRRSARRTSGRPAAPAAPVGGVKKNVKPTRGVTKATLGKAAPILGDSKIIVSNLPKDVTEKQIKDYFNQAVGGIKRVELSYGPNSQSRGIANLTFSRPEGASTAFSKLNGLLVDNRPIKIEIVVGAAQADKVITPAKSLAERTTQAKAQPKSAANDHKAKPANKAGAANGNAKGPANKKGRRARNARPSKKTQDELDSEMADYFTASNENANGAAPAATAPAAATAATAGGDAPMEDEIM